MCASLHVFFTHSYAGLSQLAFDSLIQLKNAVFDLLISLDLISVEKCLLDTNRASSSYRHRIL